MMKRFLLLTVFFIEALLIAVSPIRAQLVDATAWWLIANPAPDASSQEAIDSLAHLLVDRGKALSDQIDRVEGKACARDGVHTAILDLAHRMKRGDRLIFFYHGSVTKPIGSNSIYFLTYGATSKNLVAAIEDGELNRWFHEAGVDEAIVLFDGYTTDANLYAYLANRQLLGAAALVSIQSAQEEKPIGEGSFLQHLLSALQSDASDLDDNRQIAISELHERIVAEAPPQEGIMVPTGDVNAVVLKLSPMLKIVTHPDGASIFLNSKEIGVTPQRLIDNLRRGAYQIEVKKRGYLIPPVRSAQIDLVQGKAVEVAWTLEPIAVYGTIKAPAGESLESAKVQIEGTPYQQGVGVAGNYRFADWQTGGMLAFGKTYTLRAESKERYHAEATFTFDGYESIQRDLTLVKRTWFEVAQIRFDQKDYEGAVAAFQNGIENTTELPPMSPELTTMLFNSFSAAVDSMNIENIAYVVATAKLADRLDRREAAKVYWARVKSQAAKGTPEYKLATQRLWRLNLGRYVINIAIFILLIIVLISGGYTLYRYRKVRRNSDT